MNVVCIKSDVLPDWYTIERAEHDGRHWMEPAPYGATLMYSGRICDADVEGTSYEMIAVAKAIRARASAWFRRCAVSLVRVAGTLGYELHSPRNSQENCIITLAEADALADSIYEVVSNANQPVRT